MTAKNVPYINLQWPHLLAIGIRWDFLKHNHTACCLGAYYNIWKNTRLSLTRSLSTCMLEHLTKACQVRSASRHSHLSDWSELEGQKRREANSLEVLKRGPYREAISLVWQKGCPYQPMSYKWRMVLQRDAIDFNYFWSQLKISRHQFQLMKGSLGLKVDLNFNLIWFNPFSSL